MASNTWEMSIPTFQHWQFASGSPEEIRKAADFFGLSYNEKQLQFVHTLQTVLIGSDGKIAKVYPGNQWKPAEVAADYDRRRELHVRVPP